MHFVHYVFIDGAGYADDGEEILGITEDQTDKKRRMKNQVNDEADNKLAKKARALAHAGRAQQGAMMRFAGTGIKEGSKRKVERKEISQDMELDIDNLMDEKKPVAVLGARPSRGIPSKGAKRIRAAPIRNTLPSQNSDFIDSNQYDDYATNDNTDDGPEPTSTQEGAMEVDEKTGVSDEKKISLSKTNRKFKINMEETKTSAGVDLSDVDGFKPFIENSNEQNMSGIESGSKAAVESTAAIDTKLWIKKPEASEDPEYVNFFYLDASEVNGVIYLFGKVEVTDNEIKLERGATSVPKKFVSCCVAVHNVERNLFVLPRATGGFNQEDGSEIRANFNDVYSEINKVLVPSIIPKKQGMGFKCALKMRDYAFEHGSVPRKPTQYLKVKYSAKHGTPTPAQCAGGKHYERIFGGVSSALELFMLKRKMKGPGWLKIQSPRLMPQRLSWCKLEFGVENPKSIAVAVEKIPNPPLVTMSVSMKTAVNPHSHTHEVIAISGLVHTEVQADVDTDVDVKFMRRFTYIRPLGVSCGNQYAAAFPHDLADFNRKQGSAGVFETLPNERAMLSKFFIRLQQEDPDIMASHNLFGFEFDVILNRAIANKIPQWDRLGRLRKSKPPRSINDANSIAGRILCDTYKAAKEFLRETTYSLSHLAASQLKKNRIDVEPMDVPRFFSSSKDIHNLYRHTENDTMLVQSLMLKLQVVPLTKQLTNLSGNLWSRTMRGARAERIEYLLLHEFHEKKYILPERKPFEKKAAPTGDDDDDDAGGGDNKVGGNSRKRGKAAYAGGLVLEPKKGLYDTMVLLLDFNSLYPSIIQEYNLCFTTVDYTKFMPDSNGKTPAQLEAEAAKEEDDDEGGADSGAIGNALPPTPEPGGKPGILPRVIKYLVDRRKIVKALLKNERDPVKKQEHDIRQKALKLTANSMYGCLGFSFSRFYARPIAALVTSKGREALQRTVDLSTNALKLDVIYGDTDSVMINTNSTDLVEVNKLGRQVTTEVNKLYKDLELDIDGVFSSMLLLKKKKYAAMTVVERDGELIYEPELKGLDLVRRDWCPLSKNTGKWVVDNLLSGRGREDIVIAIHDHLADLAVKVRSGNLELKEFVVTKGLNKNPKDYPDVKGQPHLQVALRMLQQNKPVNIGDHIPYVICKQGPEGSTPPQRAYHPDEVFRSNGELTLDYEWYLTNQILPPISRLCDPIEGTSTVTISEKLGLDSSKFKQSAANDDQAGDEWTFTPKCKMDDAERFKDCVKVEVACGACSVKQPFQGCFNSTTGTSGLSCSECGSIYLGRNNAMDCYAYLSNKTTNLVRE